VSPGPERDWDKELADIDRLMAKTPPGRPAPPAAGAGPPAVSRARSAPPVGRRQSLFTWVRVGLGATLGAAMTQWPYGHACGVGLWLYLGAVGTVGLAGIWGAVGSWRHRMPVAHVVSLLVLLWGGVLAAAIVLPRIGYAREAASWFCG
jgi:hypothetical protein